MWTLPIKVSMFVFSSAAAVVSVEEQILGMWQHYTMVRPIQKLVNTGNMPGLKPVEVTIDTEA